MANGAPKRAAKKVSPLTDNPDEAAWDPSDSGDVSVPFLIEAAIREGIYAYDLETTGLSPRKHRIEGVAFYVPNDKAPDRKPVRAWFPFVDGTMDHATGGEITSVRSAMNQRRTMDQLRELWSIPGIIAIRHNGGFDDGFLFAASGCESPIVVKNLIADSMLADYLSDERRKRYGLKIRVEQVFGHKMTTYDEAAGKQGVFAFALKKPLGAYAVDDTMWTYRLWKWAMDSMRKQDPPREHKGSDWKSPYFDDGLPGVFSDLEKIFWNVEMKVQRVLMEMEIQGCLIDWEWLVQVEQRLESEKLAIMEEIQKLAGWAPNLRSPKQVSDFLYKPKEEGGLGLSTDNLDDTYNETADSYSTADKAIAHFGKKEPVVKLLLDYRSKEVISRSFSQKLIVIAQDEGRVHARFRQTGTKIGRLSCADPVNLMNQPREKNLIRKSFCAKLPNDTDSDSSKLIMLDADYSQMELRMAAHLSQEKGMLEVFRNTAGCKNGKDGDGIAGGPCDRYMHFKCFADGCGKIGIPKTEHGIASCGSCNSPKVEHQKRCRHVDLHQRTAEDVNVKRDPLAKNSNFGLLYEMGALKFAIYCDLYDDAGHPRVDYARELIEKWHEAYPGIKPWHKIVIEKLLKNHLVAYNLIRRRRRLDDDYRLSDHRAGRQAIQFEVSGSCQEIIKLAMIRIYEERNRRISSTGPAESKLWEQFRFLIQVHDELVLQGREELREEMMSIIKTYMEGAAKNLSVPFLVDVRSGVNWEAAH